MLKNNGTTKSVDIRTILVSSFIGLAAVLLTALCCGLLVIKEVLPCGGWSIMSRAALAVGALAASLYVRERVRGARMAQSLIGCAVMLIYTWLISFMYPGGDFEIAGLLVSAAVVAFVCVLCSLNRKKNGKMHKRRKR